MLDMEINTVTIPKINIEEIDELETKYAPLISSNIDLDRSLVSYQANKSLPVFRWLRYKEGFSAPLVSYLIRQSGFSRPGTLLDPFSGTGAALFVAQDLGWQAIGIELLPVGITINDARQAAKRVDLYELKEAVLFLKSMDLGKPVITVSVPDLTITAGAYPQSTKRHLDGYLSKIESANFTNPTKTILRFAALTVLESISYTRKDGQYLRWDKRAGKRSSTFDKGYIPTFKDTVLSKIEEIIADIQQQALFSTSESPKIIKGSVLSEIHELGTATVDLVITSPPYLNRYDYTRTYALELAFLGIDNEAIKKLRQDMLSCTVENRDKDAQIKQIYSQKGKSVEYGTVLKYLQSVPAFDAVINKLEQLNNNGNLNNPGVIRMVRNYFVEMAFVIAEISRTMRNGARMYMVNDNVRYGGLAIPVDLILSELACRSGILTERIWTLTRGKETVANRWDDTAVKKLGKVCMSGRKSDNNKDDMIVVEPELNAEANRITYSLRSTFFYRRLKELGYFSIIRDIDSLVKHSRNYSWEERKHWNITHNAWDLIAKNQINPLRVFTHPKVIVEHPRLISYYRSVAAISQKGIQYLAFTTKSYEQGKKESINYKNAVMLSKVFNSLVSGIVESTLSISMDELTGLMYCTAGVQVDGSWRNKIGNEAENIVKSYLSRPVIEDGQVDSLIDRTGSPLDFKPRYDYLNNISNYRGLKLKNKSSLLFSSEPDITLIDSNGKPFIVIEVKGGTDPAGALERLGAINKSFQHAREQNSDVTTILVVSCITEEMKSRLETSSLVDEVYNLTALIMDMDYRECFMRRIISEIIPTTK